MHAMMRTVPPQPAPQVPGAAAAATISHYDPRGVVNMLALGGETLSQREHHENPSAGTMLLWNSFINHSVHPNMAQIPRVSISFNVQFEQFGEKMARPRW